MKRTTPFLFLLSGLSVLSGYLLSKASVVGKTGINLFYKEYKFLKTWWKGAAAVFFTLLLLFAIQGILNKRLSPAKSRLVHLGAIVLAAIGLFLTYNDFRNTLTHRLLGERFHIGAYLFWIGWMLISLFYLFQKRMVAIPELTIQNELKV